MEAAAWLFKRKSYVRTNMDEIACRAGIKKSTIFYYFPSKEHLLYDVLCECAKRGLKKHQSAYNPDDTPKENLKRIIMNHLHFNLYNSFGGISLFEQKNLSPKLRKSYTALRDVYEQFFRDIVEAAMSSCYLQKGDVHLQTRLILGMVNSVSYWYKEGLPLSIDDVGKGIYELIFSDDISHEGNARKGSA